MPRAYFFRPNFDLATNYMHYWLGLAKSDVSSLGFQVLDSQGPYATRYSFFDAIQTYNPDIIIADGHGDPSTLTGQGLEEVLKACVNNEALSGKVTCALSCLTGQNLGPDSRNKEAQAYVGFVNEFTWIVMPPYNPPNDSAALPFQEIVRKLVTLGCLYRLEQISLKEWHDGIVDAFNYWEDYFSVPPGSDHPFAPDILLSLRHDKKGVISVGKEGVTYVEALPLSPLLPIGIGLVSVAWAYGLF